MSNLFIFKNSLKRLLNYFNSLSRTNKPMLFANSNFKYIFTGG